jgi:hypothetical protein
MPVPYKLRTAFSDKYRWPNFTRFRNPLRYNIARIAACHDQPTSEAVLRCRVCSYIKTCHYRGRDLESVSDSISAIEAPASHCVWMTFYHMHHCHYAATVKSSCIIIVNTHVSISVAYLELRSYKGTLGPPSLGGSGGMLPQENLGI